ncbi:glycerophosphodiester phosphodiesterase family protein [Altericroceibacterium indicum]|nr:glycerophosphodiester phosphodiesterase family protein [Altericroceibacterium indicum]
MIVAHRACWIGTSENSIAAIHACITAGIDMVELDVRMTSDGVLVLMHDATVDRMTEGTGQLSDLSWAQLQKLHLRADRGHGTPLTQNRIPTFEDALRAAKDRILINIDAKTDRIEDILAVVDKVGSRAQVLFKAEAPVDHIRAKAPWIDQVHFQPIIRQPAMQKDPAAIIASYDTIGPVSYEIDIKDQAFTPVLTPLIDARCARYWIDTLAGRAYDDDVAIRDPDRVWGRLFAHGVNAIQTDAPLELKAYIERTGAKARSCSPP